MSVKQRLIEFIKIKNIGQKKFAQLVGVSDGYVNAIRVSIQPDTLHKIAMRFPDLNTGWLLTGEGEMLKNESESHSIQAKDYSLVPLYNMDARGGFGTNDEVDTVEYIQDYMPFKNAKQGDICVPVTGKSMLPTYYPGSIILLHEIECWRDFLEMGQVYVIILTDGRRLLKELRHSLENRKTHILCVSHNPEIQDSELPTHMIYKVFLVTALYQKTTM